MLNFKQWMNKVDETLVRNCGLDHQCLGDFLYADAFQDEQDPEEVAYAVLEQEGFPFE